MNKLKIMTILGTRPEIIRLSEVIKKCDKYFDHVLVHTGQNWDFTLNQIFFEDLGLREPDYYLDAVGGDLGETIGNIIAKSYRVLSEVKPDGLLVLGDTNSALSAISAKRLKVPIFHMEAGNRCFDQRVPEESNRKIVDHIADMNLTYSSIAREYLLHEGLPADRIIKTGSPMYEVLHHYLPKIRQSDILQRLGLEKEKYFVVSAHREENINSEKNFFHLVEILNLIADRYGFPVIVSTHPRTRKMIEEKQVQFHPSVQLMKPMGFSDYNQLQMNAYAVLSDSGTISEESSILNFRALNIREAHERPEAMEEAAVMMVGLNPERVMQGLIQLQYQITGTNQINESTNQCINNLSNQQINDFPNQQINTSTNQHPLRPVADYSMPNVSDKVVRIIISYTDYIKRVVWGE